ncbi:hypothetical protein B0H13DRAFT_1895123 [Mycena leptocephala]|nr:hypothetical protein B0H13DRAFT_1895123 [Mycena leptocephala]
MSAGDQCALGPDGKLLPASEIAFYNDPDDEHPLPPVKPSSQKLRVRSGSNLSEPEPNPYAPNLWVQFEVHQKCRTEPVLRFGVRGILERTEPNRTPATLRYHEYQQQRIKSLRHTMLQHLW